MNITKQKQIHRHRKQTSGYQWGEDWGEGQDRGRGLEVQTTRYKVNNIQGCNVHHREYNQYFTITLNGV